MLDWIISVIHDPHSPVWFSRDIFRSVFQSLLGATASALLVAPLTARWVAERRGAGAGDEDAFGDALVAAYDATFPRSGERGFRLTADDGVG